MNEIQKKYKEYIKNWVRIRTNSNNFTPVGILDRISHGILFLQPSLRYEILTDWGIELRLQTRIPTRVFSEHINEIELLTKDYAKRLVTRLIQGYDTHQLSLF